MTILTILNRTRVQEGKSKIVNSLKKGLYSYIGLLLGMCSPLSPSLTEFAKELYPASLLPVRGMLQGQG